jgi:streptogramin lyase
VKEVQTPFASLKPSATIKVGGTADWVLITDDAVWVASTKSYAVHRIDPATNRIVATVPVSGDACSGLASGFGSIWVPLCGKKPELVRIDEAKNTIIATTPIPPAGPEGGITASDDSVWIITDKNGTLNRIEIFWRTLFVLGSLWGRSPGFSLLAGVLFGRSTKATEPSAGLMRQAER